MTSDSRNCDPIEDMTIVEVGKVLEAVRKYGAYSSVVFDNPVTQAVIADTYGGWPRLCAECDAKGFRQEFARVWAAYCRQRVGRFAHLPGTFEIANRSNGFDEHVPPPELIGYQNKAHSVLKAGQETDVMNSRPRLKQKESHKLLL